MCYKIIFRCYLEDWKVGVKFIHSTKEVLLDVCTMFVNGETKVQSWHPVIPVLVIGAANGVGQVVLASWPE